MWPIRDTSGQTLGFGARRLYEDDQGPKYLNTPETPVYHKSQVLYGLDVAKRAISRGHQAVVVEGYTDVMACHLAGVETAVATCGTAFGKDHIAVLRRIMGDDSASEVIFTFDPDEAGQKAALRAFSEEKRFTAQTYVAVAPDGLDPSDLRQHRGDEAVRELFTRKVPLFEFALRQAVSRFDLNSVEGRVAALREAAPIIAAIKDPSLCPGYTRELARMLGSELREVQHAVRTAESRPLPTAHTGTRHSAPQHSSSHGHAGESNRIDQLHEEDRQAPRISLAALPNNPQVWLERDALMAILQQGAAIGSDLIAQAVTVQVSEGNLRVVRTAIAAVLQATEAGSSADVGGEKWVSQILEAAPETHRGLIRELAMAPMPQRRPEQLVAYAKDVVISLLDRDLQALKGELVTRMQRIGDPSDEGSRRIQEQLVLLESARRGLRETA